MRSNFSSFRLGKVLIFLLLLAIVSSGVFGCAAQRPQGWSGITAHNSMLYFGSMDGKVLALNPLARHRGLAFPAEGEWEYSIKVSSPPSMLSCPGAGTPALPTGIYGTPVVTGGLVYVGTYSGKVYALNAANGALRWVYPREGYEVIGAIVGGLVVAEGTIYVGSSDGRVYALDAAFGDRKWQFDTGGKVWASVAVRDGVVYVSNFAGKLYALSGRDGKELWKFEAPAGIASSPVIFEDSVFFGSFDHYLRAVDIASGKERWKFLGGNWFWAQPLVNSGIVYAPCLDHKVYAIEAKTGRRLWQFDAGSPIVSSPVLIGDFLVVASEAGKLHLLKSDNGVMARTISIGALIMASLSAYDRKVYVHAKNRHVYAVEAETGKIAWDFPYVDIK